MAGQLMRRVQEYLRSPGGQRQLNNLSTRIRSGGQGRGFEQRLRRLDTTRNRSVLERLLRGRSGPRR